jgi:hypothetical protein
MVAMYSLSGSASGEPATAAISMIPRKVPGCGRAVPLSLRGAHENSARILLESGRAHEVVEAAAPMVLSFWCSSVGKRLSCAEGWSFEAAHRDAAGLR